MRHRCDVLVMIWGMVGRDAEALIPIIYLLREKYNLTVEVRSVFEYSAIDCLRPKVLLTNGCNGSHQTYLVTKYATERGVYTVSLHAEGMFKQASLESDVIGWNRDRMPTVRKWYMWNKNAYRWAIEKYPQFNEVLDVAGSNLHEKYRIFRADDFDKSRLLAERMKMESVILYVGWTFDRAQRVEDTTIRQNIETNKRFVIRCLQAVAQRYNDRLLILKYHPATADESASEIDGHFDQYDNVLILRDEWPFYQLAILSDVVISFDSTTMIDAWLARKPTINLYRGKSIIATGDYGYGYASIRAGSLVPEDEGQLLAYLDEFFARGKIEDFEKKHDIRRRVMPDYIGDPDQKPSLFVAEHISKSINHASKPKRGISVKLFVTGLINGLLHRYRFLPPIGRFSHMRKHYRPEQFEQQYHSFAPKLKRYFGV
jgi:hypothetical protein